jgi:hypothetical protein
MCKSPDPPNSGVEPNCPPGSTTPCPYSCPAMEIEINNTSAANDDLVLLKSDRPVHVFTTTCRIRAISGPASTVVLTNPDGRLRFMGSPQQSLTVPADGSWVTFTMSGENGSLAIGDAKIEAHCSDARGPVKARKDVTVVWFDDGHIDIATPGTYAVSLGRFTTTGGNAADFSATARIRPAGVDCSAPQIRNLRIGIIQNGQAGTPRERVWDSPAITWNPGVAARTMVTVPTSMHRTITTPLNNDSEASVVPMYDQPGKTGTIDANSLQPPIGCTGSTAATSNDAPSTPMPTPLTLPATDSGGTVVGQVTYQVLKTFIRHNFLTWCAIFDTSTNDLWVLRERSWSVNADSSVAGTQASTDAADRAPAATPVLTPIFNTVLNDPANATTARMGAATTTFTK